MLITEIRYEQLYNITQFTNERIGITAQLDKEVSTNDADALYDVLMRLENACYTYHMARQAERAEQDSSITDEQDTLYRLQNERWQAQRELEETTATLVVAKDMLDAIRNFCETNGMLDAFVKINELTKAMPF